MNKRQAKKTHNKRYERVLHQLSGKYLFKVKSRLKNIKINSFLVTTTFDILTFDNLSSNKSIKGNNMEDIIVVNKDSKIEYEVPYDSKTKELYDKPIKEK